MDKTKRDYIATDKFTKDLIRRKARQLIGKAGFTKTDREDIQQQLYQHLIRRAKFFDPEKAHWNVFATTLIERFVADILRRKRAAKRDHQRVVSLSTVIADGEEGPVKLGDTISRRENDARLGRSLRGEHELAQLKIDVTETIASLPPEMREVAEALQRHSIAEVARRKGIPRTTLNDVVQRIRERFEDAGLRAYL